MGGADTCFYADAATFAASALLMWMVGSEWKTERSRAGETALDPTPTAKDTTNTSCVSTMSGGLLYLRRPEGAQVLPLVFLKTAGCILWGSSDVLNVVFAGGDEVDLGCIFAAVGVGCLVGPQLAECAVRRGRPGPPDPRLMVWACGVAVLIVSLSFLGMGLSSALPNIILFTFLRAIGSAILWVYSSVALQILCDGGVLGRVVAIEGACAFAAEGVSAYTAALMLNSMGPKQVATSIGMFGVLFVAVPVIVYCTRSWGFGGKGNGIDYKILETKESDVIEMT